MAQRSNRSDGGDDAARKPAVPVSRPAPAVAAPKLTLTKATAAKAVRTPPRKPTYIRLQNRMSQTLTPSVLGENGRDAEPLRLGPRETSRPVATDRLTAYTRNLIAQGRIVTV